MSEQLPDVLTHIDPSELAHALVTAWRSLFGATPRRESILVLLAQSALETGRWKSCHAYNLGNAKHVPNDGRDFTYFRCNEILDGKVVWFNPPHPACCFRAFRSLGDGALDYLSMMRRNFHSAWPFVEAGDPRGFVRALKAAHYFTAALAPYEASVVSIFSQYGASLHFEIKPDDQPIDDETRERTMGLVARTLKEMTLELGDRETIPPPPDEPVA